MKKWQALLIIALFLLLLVLSFSLWFPFLSNIIGENAEIFQGLEALIQILLWSGIVLSGLFSFLTRRKENQSGKTINKIKTEGGAVFKEEVNVNGDFSNRDINHFYLSEKYWRTIHHSPTLDEKEAVKQYLRNLFNSHRYLNFRGMGVDDRLPLKFSLLEVYVPLLACQELPEGETWDRVEVGGRELKDAEGNSIRMSEPRQVIDILQEHSGLVILGDPGSGKTTFLKYLALMFASAKGEELGLGERFPVLVPLSAYANALSKGDRLRLDDFIADYYHEMGSDLQIADLMKKALSAGAALILFDGLDEVKEVALRQKVVDQVTNFYHLFFEKGNKFVITSRIVGYREVRPVAEKLVECTLVDFTDKEIKSFVHKWVNTLVKKVQGETIAAKIDAEREQKELLDAVQKKPGVRKLAANPLLLTILALMKRQGVTLPERRVQLYDKYVCTLISSWNRARSLNVDTNAYVPDEIQTLRILAPLALWMHEESPGVGLVKQKDLERKLIQIFEEKGESDPEAEAKEFLSDVRVHAALLLERGSEEYGFIHLTFEEYLAAAAVALSGQGSGQVIAEKLLAHLGEQPWREVSLLAVGYLGIIQQLDSVAGEVVERLAATNKAEAVILAGEAVLDARPAGVPQKSCEKVTRDLINTMQDVGSKNEQRRRAGLVLGDLGWQPPDLENFAQTPAGKFLYGDKKEEREIKYPYWIGKYPLTNLQFERFINDGGYQKQEFWGKEGWKKRIKENWERPRYWLSDFSNPIFPVVGVSWYEAQAYCNWLTARGLSFEVPQGYVCRLPLEEEWERAARGVDGRQYPWGDEFDTTYSNTRQGGVSGTTAVCTFPQGDSPAGVKDLSGNVWEWTISEYGNEGRRVLRGGSWILNYGYGFARCSSRDLNNPVSRDLDLGFRVVVSLAFG